MANLLQLINKSTLIDSKAKSLVEDTLLDLKYHKYYNRTYVINQVYVALTNFYSKLDKPILEVRKAEVYPISSDYNLMIEEIQKDFDILNFESDNLLNILDSSMNQVNLDMSFINNLISNTASRYEKTKEKYDEIKMIFRDNFISSDYFDKDACSLSPCFIDTKLKYISIQPKENKNLNKLCSIKLLEGSNGFSGNTHLCYVLDNQITFVGENSLNINLGSILDCNDETWYENELFKIDNTWKKYCVNLGFNYEEGVVWVTEEDELKLYLEINFDELQDMNFISLSPYLVPEQNYIPSYIESIFITDDKGNNIELGQFETFNTNLCFAFSKQQVKRIVINFIQQNSYLDYIGHYYNTVTSNDMYYSSYRLGYRIQNKMPSIQNIGYVYNDKEQKYNFPCVRYDNTIDEIQIKNNLFNLNAELEYLLANRFCIGIRDISCNLFSYQLSSEYVSKPFESKFKINSISFGSVFMVPNGLEVEESIQFFISIDNCVTWLPIIPTNSSLFKNGYSYYVINSNINKEFRDNNIGYIDTKDDIYSVRVKILLSRPNDKDGYSPIVYHYTVMIS